MESTALVLVVSAICAALIACVASIAAAFSDAKAATTALDGLIESIPIISSVIALVLVFANPLVDLL